MYCQNLHVLETTHVTLLFDEQEIPQTLQQILIISRVLDFPGRTARIPGRTARNPGNGRVREMALSTLAPSSLTGRALGVCAGIGAAAFLGYCFYFDHSRRYYSGRRLQWQSATVTVLAINDSLLTKHLCLQWQKIGYSDTRFLHKTHFLCVF